MANRDQYDFQEPDNDDQPSSPRYFLWIAALLIVAFVGFAGGMAYFTLNQRLPATTVQQTLPATPNSGIANAVATVVDVLGTATSISETATSLPAKVPTFTATPQTTATPSPLPTATPQPATPSCPIVTGPFTGFANPAEIGCPLGGPAVVWSAIETFERGAMYWRNDTNSAYILFGTGVDGRWQLSPLGWAGQDLRSRGEAPSGLQAPVRGFGYVWSTDDTIFNQLGWARQEELGFCSTIQSFERGFLLSSSAVPSCTPDNLYNRANDSSWRHFTLLLRNDGIWRSLSSPGAQVPVGATATQAVASTATAIIAPIQSPTQTPTQPPAQSTGQRPANQGIFVARSTQPLALDGRFDDWGGTWTSLSAIVYGAENFSGLGDIAASFQTAWSVDGLYLAVQVEDDTYRAGPDGTDMWKGDGLELQFDRNLVADYDERAANNDDFQLGLSFGADLNQVRIYRWLPFALEAAFAGNGTVVRTDKGYNVEVLLPWTLFEMNGSALQPGQTYGFNMTVNDNDSDTPMQETVLSASPARTTHDNPNEWGTLVIQ